VRRRPSARVRLCSTEPVLVTITSLQQLDPSELIPARAPRQPADLIRVGEVSPEFCRFLYTAVGSDWQWTDRLGWSLDQWTEWLSRPGTETWVGWINGTPAGYLELAAEIPDGTTHAEIVYFGLLPRFIGRGIGGQLLTEGIRKAWSLPTRFPGLPPVSRVWVHTCNLDGPHALRNYISRGLKIFDVRDEHQSQPATAPAPSFLRKI
jgi:GNAT superfamily N-acetyltransferase